jgi:hypothetical protein
MKRAFLLLIAVAASAALLSFQEPTSESHRLYLEDQADRGVGDAKPLPMEERNKRDQVRRARIRELLEEGSLKTAEDFHDGAFIYQHGDTPNDYLLAHILAMVAVQKGDSKSLWICAATLDRYLGSVDQPQVFGTQYHSKNDSPYTQDPYNRSLISDQLRLDFCVPSIEQQKKNLVEFNAGRYPAGVPGCTR